MTEYRLHRLRARLTRLALPSLVLFLCSGIYTFFSDKQLLDWESTTLNIGLLAAALLLWALPTLKYLGTYVDFTNLGIRYRRGIFGSKSREVSFTEVLDVTYSRTRGVVIRLRDQEDLDLKGLSSPKAVAAELSRLAK